MWLVNVKALFCVVRSDIAAMRGAAEHQDSLDGRHLPVCPGRARDSAPAHPHSHVYFGLVFPPSTSIRSALFVACFEQAVAEPFREE